MVLAVRVGLFACFHLVRIVFPDPFSKVNAF
jgi:hypothetical protein